MMRKTCSKCKQSKPISDFYRNSANKDGLGYYCKSCRDRINKAAAIKNPEWGRKADRRMCIKYAIHNRHGIELADITDEMIEAEIESNRLMAELKGANNDSRTQIVGG